MTGRKVLAVLLLLLILGAVLARGGGSAPPIQAASGQYAVAPGQLSGGGLSLSGGSWQIRGTVGGSGFLLQGPRPLQGAGCCCTFVPCLYK